MPQKLTLATVGTLSIAGAMMGVYLGRGAIADIDPFFFTPLPESRFFADLVPAGYDPAPATRPSDLDEVWVNNLNISGRPECFDCGNFVEGLELAGVETLAPVAEIETDYSPPPVADRDYMPRDVERYAYFPVTQEEADQPRKARYALEEVGSETVVEDEPELLNM